MLNSFWLAGITVAIYLFLGSLFLSLIILLGVVVVSLTFMRKIDDSH